MSEHLSVQYQKKTDIEHILDNSDTYIGSTDATDYQTYVCNPDGSIKPKTINISPGLYNLFNEGLVNCRDHVVRMHQAIECGKPDCLPVNDIRITIGDDGIITMYNNGNGIDIVQHPEYSHWIPEMIFGHLRTSTNYNKNEQKIVGGKNGFGIKLVFIWSTWGEIETVDHTRGLKYTQQFKNNLDIIEKPKITKCKSKPYTKISFKPDFERIGIPNYDADLISLFRRRTIDIAALTHQGVSVKYNNEKIPIKTFQNYIDLYIGPKNSTKRIYESPNERWEYVVCLSPSGEFAQVSFVNGLFTGKGGKHVDYITNQIIKKMTALIEKKKKISVKPSTIKEQLMIFIRCDINNPSFDSQTKDYMSTPISKFGSTCLVTNGFIDKLAKLGVINAACALTEIKNTNTAKKSDGAQVKTIRGIPKLVDANFAGTNKSSDCTIIFCEGDSAKAGIISGLSRDDRNFIGVYPMKGKLFNTRGESAARVGGNKEITEIKKILGLEIGKEYSAETITTKLRYGKIIFMTDQDLDGSHIKGLGLNLFDSEWKSLTKIPNFIGFMNTPILKVKKGKNTQVFYNEGEYETWKANTSNHETWNIKYFKGLGTSTAKEFKEYFADKKFVMFSPQTADSEDHLDMVFNKKRTCDRKEWLSTYNRNAYLNTNDPTVDINDFIDKEMKHFSKYDNDRSIPNGIDGLKISQRKILFSAFKKKLNKEIKVAQFSGYVSEHSGYHHGEASLVGAIIGMAQNFVGSNNINIFKPNGQFGTRLMGGKDSASERYIFTELNSLTRLIYPAADDCILKYLNDDGQDIEPIYYVPIIPMILVNGCKGIGTGFSTDIMSYNPMEIIQYFKTKLEGHLNLPKIHPYYEGFKGTIDLVAPNKYLIKGCWDIVSAKKVHVTELPVGLWTEDYKCYLESLMDSTKNNKKPIIKEFTDLSTDKTVDFMITFPTGIIQELVIKLTEYGCNALEKLLKIYTTHSTTNMHLFNHNDELKKYNDVNDIIDDYYDIRYNHYTLRKAAQIDKLEKEQTILSNKARFIQETINGTIDMRNKNLLEVTQLLEERNYNKSTDSDGPFKYLIKMPMYSVTNETVNTLMGDLDNITTSLNVLKHTNIETMWTNDINALEKEYKKIYTKTSAKPKLKIT